MAKHEQERVQYERWILNQDWDVFGTLKFQPCHQAAGHKPSTTIWRYWNKLDRIFFGTAAEKGYRISRWCFSHEGSQNDNYHLHFVAKAPIETNLFCTVCNAIWTKLDVSTAGINKNWITPVLQRERVAHYLTKEVWKLGSQSFDPFLSSASEKVFHIDAARAAEQALRIARAVPHNELRAAQSALDQQKALTDLRLELRDRTQSGKATFK